MREGGEGVPNFPAHMARAQQYFDQGVGTFGPKADTNAAPVKVDVVNVGSKPVSSSISAPSTSSLTGAATSLIDQASPTAAPYVNLIQKLLGSFFPTMHEGGLVGPGMPTTFRHINPAIFATARRYHGGLASDEFPAILQKGERVLTQNQTSKAMSIMGAAVHGGAPAGSWATASAKSATINQSFNISTPDANSFKASQGQINTRASLAMRRASDRNA